MILVRQELGEVLRDVRLQKGRTLRQVASKASVALGYLSEVERGQKEASSEILASVADALETPISVIMREVGDRMAVSEGLSPIPDTLPDDLVAEFDADLVALAASFSECPGGRRGVRVPWTYAPVEFWIAMGDEFGEAYARVLVHDLVLGELDGRTGEQALARRGARARGLARASAARATCRPSAGTASGCESRATRRRRASLEDMFERS